MLVFSIISVILLLILLVIAKRMDKSIISMNQNIEDMKKVQSDLLLEASQINQKMVKQKKKIEVKAFAYNKRSMQMTYMEKMEGYFSQFNSVSKSQILYLIENLESENIEERVKQLFYFCFMLSLKSNGMKLSDLKIEDEHSPYPTVYRIDFKILNYRYIGFDEFTAIANIELTLKDGSKKVIKMDSFYRFKTEFFEIKDKYRKKYGEDMHFFDALKLTFNQFKYETTFGYDEPYWGEDNTISFIINELYHYYSIGLSKKNIYLLESSSKENGLDFKCTRKDKIWSILGDDINVVEEFDNEIETFVEKYMNPAENDLNARFINALNNYYLMIERTYREPYGYYEMKAIEIWKELAELKHPYSCLIMGVIYYDGKYVLKDISKSKEYLTKAFEYGFKKQSIKVWNDFEYS